MCKKDPQILCSTQLSINTLDKGHFNLNSCHIISLLQEFACITKDYNVADNSTASYDSSFLIHASKIIDVEQNILRDALKPHVMLIYAFK